MNWEDERYVRLYTRDTADWMALKWEARAVFPLLLRKADRAGIVQVAQGTGRPRKIAGLVGLPPEVVEIGLADLLADGCVTERDIGYCFRNFIEAQEAPQSDAQRKRESRARRRDLALTQTVTESHKTRPNVTLSHVESLRTQAQAQAQLTPNPLSKRGRGLKRVNGHTPTAIDACSDCGTWEDVRRSWGGTDFKHPICSKCRRSWAIENIEQLSESERAWWQLERRVNA